jgi:hypothetical protein
MNTATHVYRVVFLVLLGCGGTVQLSSETLEPETVTETELSAESAGPERRVFDFKDNSNQLPSGRLTLERQPRGVLFEGNLAASSVIPVTAAFTPQSAIFIFRPTGRQPVVLQGAVDRVGSVSNGAFEARRLFQRTGFLSVVQNNFYLANGSISKTSSVFAQFFKFGKLSGDVFGTYGRFPDNTCEVYEDGTEILNQRPSSPPINTDYTEVLAGDAIDFRRRGASFGRAVTSSADPFFYSADIAADLIPLAGKTASIPGSNDFLAFESVRLERANSQFVVRPFETPRSNTVFSVTGAGPQPDADLTLWIGWRRGGVKYEAFCSGRDTGSFQINVAAQAVIKAKGLDASDAVIEEYLIGRFSPEGAKAQGDTLVTNFTQEFNFMVYPGFDPNIDPNAPNAALAGRSAIPSFPTALSLPAALTFPGKR